MADRGGDLWVCRFVRKGAGRVKSGGIEAKNSPRNDEHFRSNPKTAHQIKKILRF